jgi:gluconate 2-dehydrogenase alpha chain
MLEPGGRIQNGLNMKTLKPVNVAIVGGGWTGLAMAKEITGRTSLSVLILERGAPRKPSDYIADMDELDYAIRLRLMQNIADETITHRHSLRDPAVPVRQYGSFLPGSGVGGAGEHWNGMSFRFLESHFVLATHLREKFGAAHLPENLSVQDWGVTYNDLEAYYWRRADAGRQWQGRQHSRARNSGRQYFRGSANERISTAPSEDGQIGRAHV